jgi:lipoprotein-releasing system permease protein
VVKAPFSLFLALRYLKPKRTFVSVITVISVLGVTLGIAVLIIVISVMTGFDRELQRKVLGFDAHLIISNSSCCVTGRPWTKRFRKFLALSQPHRLCRGP